MLLIVISIFSGFIAALAASLLERDGSKVNELFIFAIWIIGFFSPGLYVLDKLYEELKHKRKTFKN